MDASGQLRRRLGVEIFLDLPLGWAIFTLFCGAMMRSNGTYWLARGLVAGARRTRLESIWTAT